MEKIKIRSSHNRNSGIAGWGRVCPIRENIRYSGKYEILFIIVKNCCNRDLDSNSSNIIWNNKSNKNNNSEKWIENK